MDNITQKDWMDEGRQLFGEDVKQWKFVCPMCGRIASVQDFLDAGADANDAFQECIGRHTGKGSPQEGDSSGCNWAAYGFFGTAGKGRKVIAEDGHEVEVFQFATPDIQEV